MAARQKLLTTLSQVTLGDTVLRNRKALNKFSSNKTLVSWGTTNAPVFSYCLQNVTANVQTGFVLCFSQRSSDSSLLTSPFTDKMLTLTSTFLTRSYVTEFPSQNLMHHLITQRVETQYSCMWWFQCSGGRGRNIRGWRVIPGYLVRLRPASAGLLTSYHKNINIKKKQTTKSKQKYR